MTAADSAGQRAAEAFGFTADPSAYVPRLALESALAEMAELIGKTPACAALTGESGLGKTLLLHVLRERLGGSFECLYVPFPRLAAAEFWRWVAVGLGLGSGDDDRGVVLGRARGLATDGSGLVLLVDDAGALPPSTRNELVAACETTGFSLVLAFDGEDHPQLASLPAHVRRIDLGPPMTLAETRAYVHARLRRVDPDGVISARLGALRLAQMHEASGGIPARLHALLDAWLRSPGAEAAALADGRQQQASPLPTRAPEAAHETAQPLSLPPALRQLLERIERPRVQLTLAVLCLLAIAGFWYFALQRGSGGTSVGVPVERFETPRREPVPAPALAAPVELAPIALTPAPPAEEPEPAPLEADSIEVPEPVAPAAPPQQPPPRVEAPVTQRAPQLLPPIVARPPAADPSKPEPPVEIASAKFPDEHVPAPPVAAPLAPPPAGPRLSVNAAPWAAIQLDGQPIGETPLGEFAIKPGEHVVTATLPDGRVIERRVQAQGGDVYLVFP